ncbi:MAG: universal stress protein, partial [Tepidisphaeraceae bacterium]
MKLLIAYDGSEHAQAVFDDLARAGLPADAQAVVISVAEVYPRLPASCYEQLTPESMETVPPALGKAHALASRAMAEARSLAHTAAEHARRTFPNWQVQELACADVPQDAIVKAAHDFNADLVVVGSRGRSAVERLFLGTVAQKVVTHVPCSARIARPRADGAIAPRIVIGVDLSDQAATAVSAVASRTWPPGTQARAVLALDMRLA